MKNYTKLIFASVFFIITFQNCTNDYDDIIHHRKVNDFIWKGMNQYYYWQENVPNLYDTRFLNLEDYNSFLNQYASPESIFQNLRANSSTDKFSTLFSDYDELESILKGTTKTNGLDYELKYKSNSQTELFGWVRYVLPNSDASSKSINRGTIFFAVDGVALTTENYKSLLSKDTYTLSLANYNNGEITPNGETISLSKSQLSENPISVKNVFTIGDKKIGYLLYNGFYSDYKSQLNDVFSYFLSQNVTHLILDLRYNSGGSIEMATELASMITGQFNGEIFAKQLWNEKMTNRYSSNPDALLNKFTNTLSNGSQINSLNLSKLYVITSKATASASELLINGLTPYINVVRIGGITTGKNVGSITLYDSPTFTKDNINPTHKYAIQPIVLKLVNKDNFGSYQNGFFPHVPQYEDFNNLGILGDSNELLLSTALNYIQNNGRQILQKNKNEHQFFKDTKSSLSIERGMYLE